MKWCIVFDKNCHAVQIAKDTLSEFVDYTVEEFSIDNVNENFYKSHNIIYIGKCRKYTSPADGYRIKSFKTEIGTEVIILTGCDEINTVYASYDFKNKLIPKFLYADHHCGPYYFHKPFVDPVKEYDKSFSPYIKKRALWTWGYVIYDYKRYIDNMVRLKFNMLVIWNDYPPENAQDIVSYAHKNGVKIIWGFSWGWDTNCKEIDVNNLDKLKENVINTYEKNYAHLGGDGIYFQSFTELGQDKIGDVIIAEAVTELVNVTSAELLEKYPDLYIQFGLHATSVKSKLKYIKNVDPRVTIFWEDCGAFPYAYLASQTENYDEAVELTEKLMNLRVGENGTLFKGLTCLDWTTFEHQKGKFILGQADKEFIEKRTEQKMKIWRYVQAYWMENAHLAHNMIKFLSPDTLVGALLEDGMLESQIPYPAALLSEMLWDTESDTNEILSRVALMPDVKFS